MAIFTGAGVAIVTPMYADGSVNFEKLEKIINDQINNGTDAIVICGTTGESSTLSEPEHIECIRAAVAATKKRVPVIAGTGSNDTQTAIYLTKEAEAAGADGALLVSPYYNKATQKGLIAHFKAVAESVSIPVILYNVPGRTGVNIKPETYARLAENPKIVGIKEANGDISSVVDTMSRCGDKIDMYSGNDDQIVPILSMGGIGCISVISNLLPAETKQICQKWFDGDPAGAAALQMKYKKLIDALFSEVNPIPIKAALHALGLCSDYARLPLTPMSPAARAHLIQCMREVEINV